MRKKFSRTFAVAPSRVTTPCLACGSMVLFDQMFVVLALYERQNDKQEKGCTTLPKARNTKSPIFIA
jgi:hypothetical protein